MFVLALILGVLASVSTPDAEPAAKPRLIGILTPGPISARAHLIEALRQGLRELGYVEGQNIVLEVRSAEGRDERLLDLAMELVRANVEVIVTGGTQAAFAARRASTTVPIVAPMTDPVGTGLAASLARPGGNVTGNTTMAPELAGKRLELLKEVVPRVSRVAVLWNPASHSGALSLKEARTAAQALGLKVQSLEVGVSEDIEPAFTALAKERADGLMVVLNPLTFTHRKRIVDLAAKRRLPGVFELREFADAGGLMAYGASLPDMWRRTATYVDKILKGAKPAELPIEQPTRFELVVNMKTAKALGLTIPQSVLVLTDQVIQ